MAGRNGCYFGELFPSLTRDLALTFGRPGEQGTAGVQPEEDATLEVRHCEMGAAGSIIN